MREIKFRLIKNNKIVGYEKHTQNKGNFKSSIFHSCLNDNDIGYEWNNINILTKKMIDYDFKEQYTGLKDKNDKEIYFNSDIVRFKVKTKDLNFESMEIEERWIELEGTFNFHDEELRTEIDILPKYEKDGYICLWYDFLNMKDFEVIGNIHDKESK